ncbi:GGDEF domain-containing protein [Alcanivorax sp. S6407]|uniref:GGDEF domain-containing protein n=1 Tax=Alcanivorax sp. S6407 TaxID=2926424 RepID=UPI001FF2AD8C|nr:GGDEF domain-containing protein [Alcanivorax sp. S6407]MCK0153931.1 GGDEF domain-containing protein [Alcanivorax sp. S6407]
MTQHKSEEKQQQNAGTEDVIVAGAPVTPAEKAELAHLNAMLHQRLREPKGMHRAFPEPLETIYRRSHLEITQMLQNTFWPWVVVSVGLFCILGALMAQNQQAVIYPLNAVISVAVLVPVAVLKIKRLARFILYVNGLAASVTLLAFQIASVVLPDQARQKSVSEYAIIFITIAAFTIARLPLRHAVVWVGVSMISSRVLALMLGLDPELDVLLYFGGGSLIFGYLLGFIQDARERTVFAQEYLLEEEKRQLKQLSSELAQLSRSDQLTGLPNRRYFDEMLDMQWQKALREGTDVNLMFMDIDYFKLYNDHYGHQAGDDCLLQVAKALGGQVLRSSDFVARYGGEEFVALFHRTNREGLEKIAHRLIQSVDELQLPHEKSCCSDFVTLSIGIASLRPTADNCPETLIKLADEALYEAKKQGRHRFLFSDTTETQAAVKPAS